MTAAQYRAAVGQPPPGADREPQERFPGETAFQCAVVRWWDALDVLDGSYLLAIPNGGKRSKVEAAILIGMGVRAGAADLCVILPGGRCGWVELKHGDGRLSKEQRAFRDRCLELGHLHAEARTIDQVRDAMLTFGVQFVEPIAARRILEGR
jgi:hypothetical protein